MTLEFSWLDSNESLARACESWAEKAFLCIDTEFVRRTTFYPKLGLVQVSDGDHHYLIDPLSISDWQPFVDILHSSSIVKVMHSASEDIDVFFSSLEALPKPLFDTQIASGIAGLASGWGFAKMVEHFTGKIIDKGETTSDWLARPLSTSQCQYAVADVAYLVPCYKAIRELLLAQQRLDWVLEDGERLIDNHPSFLPHEQMYTRVKGVGRLDAKLLPLCQAIAHWRDDIAKAQDKPRSRILKDSDLLAICQRQPEQLADLPRSDYLNSRWIKRFGDDLMTIIAKAKSLPKEQWPDANLSSEPSGKAKRCYQAMKQVVETCASQENIAEASLASKKDLYQLIQCLTDNNSVSEFFSGWRKTLLLDQLCECCGFPLINQEQTS